MRIKLLSIMIIGMLITSSSFAQVLRDEQKRESTTNSGTVSSGPHAVSSVQETDDFEYFSEQFADLRIIRYQIPGWDKLTIKQKKLAYFLTQAGYSGRDIIWDQNYRHNLVIRHALENIITKASITLKLLIFFSREIKSSKNKRTMHGRRSHWYLFSQTFCL